LRYTETESGTRLLVTGGGVLGTGSSAAAHCGADSTGAWLAMHLWRGRRSAITWRAYLDAGVTDPNWQPFVVVPIAAARWLTGVHPDAGKRNQTPPGAPKNADPRRRPIKREPGDIFLWCLVDHLSLVEPIRTSLCSARHFRWWLLRPVPKLPRALEYKADRSKRSTCTRKSNRRRSATTRTTVLKFRLTYGDLESEHPPPRYGILFSSAEERKFASLKRWLTITSQN